MTETAPAPAAAPAAAPDAPPDTQGFRVSENAAKRIAVLAGADDTPAGARLRVTVSGGGCSGFQYGFDLDAAVNGDDVVITAGAAEVVIDETSLPFVAGAELDYVEELVGSYFAVRNPNASSTCGCGVSFSV